MIVFMSNSSSLLHTQGNDLFNCRLSVESDEDNSNLSILQRIVSHCTVIAICLKLYSILNKLVDNYKFISAKYFY